MAVLYTHTRGEWVADIGVGQVYAVSENGESVAVAIVYGTYDNPSECQANARLIAAAPKLQAENAALARQRDELLAIITAAQSLCVAYWQHKNDTSSPAAIAEIRSRILELGTWLIAAGMFPELEED